MSTVTFTKAITIEITKLGEKFNVPIHEYSTDALVNAMIVGLHRIGNDAMSGVVRRDFPTGVAGDESFREVGWKRVRVRFANLANADKKAESDPLAGLSPEEKAAVLAIRAKKTAA